MWEIKKIGNFWYVRGEDFCKSFKTKKEALAYCQVRGKSAVVIGNTFERVYDPVKVLDGRDEE